MAKKVKHSDLFEAGIFEKDLPAIKLQIQAVDLLTQKYKDQLVVSAKLDAKNIKTKKQIDEFNKATTKSREAVVGINKAKKEKVNLDKQLLAAQDKEIKGKLRLQRANKQQRDALKAEIVLTDKLAGTEEKLLAKNTKLRIERKKLNTETRKGRTELKRINKELDANNKRIDKNSDKLKKQKRNVGNYTSAIRGLGRGLAAVGLTAGIGSIVGNISGIVTGFEQGGANLASVLGKTRKEITLLTEDAKRLGSVTAFTAREILGLQTEFAKLGFSEKEILDATEATLALAAATGTELAEAAAVAGATLGGFGLGAEQTQRAVDVMAKSFSTSALDMEKFKESMKTAAPAAKAVGLSIEKTTALLGTMANAGIAGSKAGNNLKTSLINLNKAGISLEDGLAKVANSADKLGTATKLVGKNAAASFLVLAEGTEETKKLEKGLQNAGGAAQKMADTQLDTLTGRTKLMTSAWEGFILSLEDGEGVFAQVANTVVEGITNMLNNMAKLGQSAKQLREDIKGAREEIGSDIATKQLQRQFEFFEKSNESLEELIKNRGEGHQLAERELEFRKLELTESQKVISIQSRIAVGQKTKVDKLKEELKLRRSQGIFLGIEALQREIDVEEGLRQGAREITFARIKVATEKELIELADRSKDIGASGLKQRVAIARLAEKEIQRRKDIAKIDGGLTAGGVTKRAKAQLTGLEKMRAELSKINKLRSDELVLKGQSAKFDLLTRDTVNLEEQIKLLEEKLRLTKDIEKVRKKGIEDIEDITGDVRADANKDVKKVDVPEIEEKDILSFEDGVQSFADAATALTEILNKRSDERIEQLDKELEANRSHQAALQELAKQGIKDADDSIAFEKKREAELELLKQQELEKKAKRELTLTAIQAYSGYVQDGKSGASALASTVTDIEVLKAFINGLDSFFEGTEDTGTVANALDGNGGRLTVTHDNERIMTAEQNQHLGGISNWELANLGASYKRGTLGINQAMEMERFSTSGAVLHKFDELKDAIKEIEAPSTDFHYDSIRNAFIKSVETKGKITRSIKIHRGLW